MLRYVLNVVYLQTNVIQKLTYTFPFEVAISSTICVHIFTAVWRDSKKSSDKFMGLTFKIIESLEYIYPSIQKGRERGNILYTSLISCITSSGSSSSVSSWKSSMVPRSSDCSIALVYCRTKHQKYDDARISLAAIESWCCCTVRSAMISSHVVKHCLRERTD